MSEFEDDDLEFTEKVIEKNREGLERLAREEDAAEKRGESFTDRLKRLLQRLREIRKSEDTEEASFTRIENFSEEETAG